MGIHRDLQDHNSEGTILIVLSTFLMMTEMTQQSMDKKEGLEILTLGMSQKQQSLKPQKVVILLQENPETQLNKSPTCQKSNQSIMTTRMEATLEKPISSTLTITEGINTHSTTV